MDFHTAWCAVCLRLLSNPDALYCSPACRAHDAARHGACLCGPGEEGMEGVCGALACRRKRSMGVPLWAVEGGWAGQATCVKCEEPVGPAEDAAEGADGEVGGPDCAAPAAEPGSPPAPKPAAVPVPKYRNEKSGQRHSV